MVTESVEQKLMGVTFDKNLDFKSHVNPVCKKAGKSSMHLHVFQVT